MLGFVGCMASVTTAQLCRCGLKAATDNRKRMGVAEVQSSFIYKNGWLAGFSPPAIVCGHLLYNNT